MHILFESTYQNEFETMINKIQYNFEDIKNSDKINLFKGPIKIQDSVVHKIYFRKSDNHNPKCQSIKDINRGTLIFKKFKDMADYTN